MTNNEQSRLDSLENLVKSNSCAIQAMLGQRASDCFKREEEKAEREQRMAWLEEVVIRLTQI